MLAESQTQPLGIGHLMTIDESKEMHICSQCSTQRVNRQCTSGQDCEIVCGAHEPGHVYKAVRMHTHSALFMM